MPVMTRFGGELGCSAKSYTASGIYGVGFHQTVHIVVVVSLFTTSSLVC